MLDALQQADATVFGILSNPAQPADILNPSTHLPKEIQRLFQRVECWMLEQYLDAMVTIVPDTLDSYKHNMSGSIADFLFRSKDGKAMRHLVVTPFWVDSSVTVGAQLADVIAYVLMDSMRQRAAKSSLFDLWRKVGAMEFRSVDGATRGIKRVV